AGLGVDRGHEHRVRAGALTVVAVVAAHEEDVDVGLVRPQVLGVLGLAGAVAEEAGHRGRLYPGEDRPHAEGDADDQSEGDDEESRKRVMLEPESVPAMSLMV